MASFSQAQVQQQAQQAQQQQGQQQVQQQHHVLSEADVILPPPSALNPLPSLPAALRLDNQEQLLLLLQGNPISIAKDKGPSAGSFRQLLVFGTDSLRTLLLRQVLSDPHQRNIANKQTKKNWESYLSFPFPKSLQSNIVGTRLLLQTGTGNAYANAYASSNKPSSSSIHATLDGSGAEVSLHGNAYDNDYDNDNDEVQHVDVITYFLRPWKIAETQAVAQRIRSWKKKVKVHHRIVYVPQPTALVHQILADIGLAAASNVSIHALQLDLFPIESDVISLEYDSAMKEDGVEGMQSTLVATCARSLLKLQDIVGTIPRIQSLGRLGEDVLAKTLNQSVDEYLANDDDDHDRNNNNYNEDGNVLVVGEDPTPLPDNNIAMMLIDRKVDMVTPMVTPLTYEGLLDDIVGIECG
jgi:hypothetical protein